MKERNKSIFRILLMVSGAIVLVQTILLAVLLEEMPMRVVMPLILLAIDAASCGLLIYFTLNPQYNHNYMLRRVDGRLRWARVHYGPDPDGLRHASAGVSTLTITLIFAVIAASVLWPERVTETVVATAAGILLTAMCTFYLLIESKLRKQQ